MKRLFLLFSVIYLSVISHYIFAREDVEYNTPITDEYIGVIDETKIVRNINGGTVFIIDYEGEWTNEMKDYADKLNISV